MRRYAALLILALTAVPSFVHAEDGTPEERRACRPDVLRFCRNIQGNMDIANCLRDHRPKISHACDAVLASHGI